MNVRDDRQTWPTWGRVIDDVRERQGISQNKAAEAAGISGTRWRQIVDGRAGPMNTARGLRTIARMARVVKMGPQQLFEVNRPDAADELRRMLAERAQERPVPEVDEATLDRIEEILTEVGLQVGDAVMKLAELQREVHELREERRGREVG